MKTSRLKTMAMLLVLSISFVSCGGDGEVVESTITEPVTTTTDTVKTSGTPGTISNIADFQSNVIDGNFKSVESIYSKFDYIKREDRYTSGDNFTFTWSCNIPIICDNADTLYNSNIDIMTRTYDSNGYVYRTDADDTGLSEDLATLKSELSSLIQNARNRSNSVYKYYMEYRERFYLIKPGDGFEYGIDLDQPLAANPVFRRNLDTGEVYEFLKEYTN